MLGLYRGHIGVYSVYIEVCCLSRVIALLPVFGQQQCQILGGHVDLQVRVDGREHLSRGLPWMVGLSKLNTSKTPHELSLRKRLRRRLSKSS